MTSPSLLRLFFALLVFASLMYIVIPTQATHEPIVVNVLTDDDDINPSDVICDSNPATGNQCSLRAAIQTANADIYWNTITFDVTGNIAVTSALPEVTVSLDIIGPGANLLSLSGNPNDDYGMFFTSGDIGLVLAGMTIKDGRGIYGGVIHNRSTVYIRESVIAGNKATVGGAIYSTGDVRIERSTISGNQATDRGGAIFSQTDRLWMTNSTFSGNTASNGGTIMLQSGRGEFYNLTIVGSSSTSTIISAAAAQLSVNNTLITNASGTACALSGSVVSSGTNLATDSSCNSIGASPATLAEINLGPLANNGGPTFTHALLLNSAAMNAGQNWFANITMDTDQRGIGYPRIYGGVMDIGAFEYQQVVLTPLDNPVVNVLTDGADTNLRDNVCDSDPAVGNQCSLRAAIQNAIADPDVDTITFSTEGVITLMTALPQINSDINFLNTAGKSIHVTRSSTAQTNFSIFHVTVGTQVTIDYLTLSGGTGTPRWRRLGGGIFNEGGILTVRHSTITNNSTDWHGGGILNEGGTLTVTESFISGNRAEFEGGGIASYNMPDLDALKIINSTISGNQASEGGGLYTSGGRALIRNATIALNSGDITGGFANGSETTLQNTIISGNTGYFSADIDSLPQLESHNLIGVWLGAVNPTTRSNIDPLLAPLANNGGSTQTYALLPGSPAIDAGNNSVIAETSTTDQRGSGFARIIGGTVDIGAFEVQQPAPPPANALNVNVTSDNPDTDLHDGLCDSESIAGVQCSLRAAIQNANADPDADIITIDLAGVLTLNTALPGLNRDVTIAGLGANLLMIQPGGAKNFPIFSIPAEADVTISGMTLVPIQVGTVQSWGNLILKGVAVGIKNSSEVGMGSVATYGGTLVIIGSTFQNNFAFGGSLMSIDTTVTIINSTFSYNDNSYVESGTISVHNSPVTIYNSTFLRHSFLPAFGIENVTITAYNSVFADGACAQPTIVTGGNNLTNMDCMEGVTKSTVLNLVSATQLGGSIQAAGFVAGSDLLDAGNSAFLPADAWDMDGDGNTVEPLPVDQRGFSRVQGAVIDIGAVEGSLALPPTNPVVNVVNSVSDPQLGDGLCDVDLTVSGNQCSVRAALENAYILPNEDTITFDATVFAEPRTIEITSTLLLNSPVRLQGTGASRLTIRRDSVNSPRDFAVFTASGAGNAIYLDGITISGGTDAGIYNSATLTIRNSVITENRTNSAGAGIENMGELTVENSVISRNVAVHAGAIYHGNWQKSVRIVNSQITENTSTDNGGALSLNIGQMTVINSTISGNKTNGSGGGIYLRGTSSTLFTLQNVTLTNNTADADGNGVGTGGGIFRDSGGIITVQNSIVASNQRGNTGNNCAGMVTGSASVATDATCGTSFTQVTAAQLRLLPLAYNGGTTQTHALGYTSVAIDAGNSGICAAVGNTDQRGIQRPFDGNFDGQSVCDIGAYEFNTDILRESDPVIPTTPVAPPPFVLSPPVLTNIDGGGLDWVKSGSWSTHAGANFTGSGGLGWQILGTPSGAYTLQWQHQVNLAGVNNPRLSFASSLAASTSRALVQVRISGTAAWTTLATLTSAADWQTVMIDLSAYKGQTIELRFAWIANGNAADLWRVDNVYVFNMSSQSIPAAPANPVIEIPAEIVLPNDLIVEPTPEPTPDVIIVPVDPQ